MSIVTKRPHPDQFQTTTQKDFHYVATGAAENGNEIHLWSKPVSQESGYKKNGITLSLGFRNVSRR